MFFRTKIIRSTPLLQLVESYRNAEGQPRQRVVASLGDATLPEGEKKQIARAVEARLRGEYELLARDLSKEAAGWVDRIVKVVERSQGAARSGKASALLDGVLCDEIETDNVVEYGPELVGMTAWEGLGLTETLKAAGMNPRAIATAQMMTINRLIEPLSEWALIEWAERTALPECLGVRITKTLKDRLYKTSDTLLSHRDLIEEALRTKEADLFGLRQSLILYDLTNTHFEGVCEENPKARRGRNKQKRNDCVQVALGIAFDALGFPLAHEVFEGNIAECKTLERMLERLHRAGEGDEKPVVILDAGLATRVNIDLLKEKKYSFLVNVTRGSRATYAEYFTKEGFCALPGRKESEQVEVKMIVDPDHADERLVLCRSRRRGQKEEAMLSRAESRFLEDAKALVERVAGGRLKNEAKINQAIGRLSKKHPRVARFYEVELEAGSLRVQRREENHQEALELCGDYVLRTDQTFEASELWHLYMMLLKAESGFRALKGTLGLRPNFHRKENRVEGHIFISVIAYHLLCWIQTKLERTGERRDWRTIRRALRTHCLVTTRLPLEDGRVMSIRKPSRPDEEQARIYKMLEVNVQAAYRPVRTERKGASIL